MEPQHQDISRLLQSVNEGDGNAIEAIIPLVYDELRAMARARLRRARPGSTIDATSLVHDVYMRLFGRDIQFANRRHFFFAAGRAMSDVLYDRARRSDRRSAAAEHAASMRETSGADGAADTIVGLREAMPRLQAVDARAHDVVMLRFFAGLSFAQVADALGVTERTAERDWRFARTWLYEALRIVPGSSGGLSGVAMLTADAGDGAGE